MAQTYKTESFILLDTPPHSAWSESNAVTPSTGPPTSDGVLYILRMGDGTIPTVRKNKFTENRQSVNETLIFDNWRCVYKNWGHTGPLNCTP